MEIDLSLDDLTLDGVARNARSDDFPCNDVTRDDLPCNDVTSEDLPCTDETNHSGHASHDVTHDLSHDVTRGTGSCDSSRVKSDVLERLLFEGRRGRVAADREGMLQQLLQQRRNRSRRRWVSVLSFDGGGSRGVMELVVLDYAMKAFTRILEDPTGIKDATDLFFEDDDYETAQDGIRKFVDILDDSEFWRDKSPIPPSAIFDMIVGTSTGGLITMALLGGNKTKEGRRARMTVEEVKDIYRNHTSAIFGQSAWGSFNPLRLFVSRPYSQSNLKGILDGYFGDTTFKDIESTCVGGCVAKRVGEEEKLEFFSTVSIPSMNVKIKEALCATSDAPVYFETPVKVGEHLYVDGGVGGNCPLAQAIPTAINIWGEAAKLFVVSLAPPPAKPSSIPPEVHLQIKYWLEYFPTQVTDGTVIYNQLQKQYEQNRTNPRFLRIYPRGTEVQKYEMDEVDVEAMIRATKTSILEEGGVYDVLNMALALISLYFNDVRKQKKVRLECDAEFQLSQGVYDFVLRSCVSLGSKFFRSHLEGEATENEIEEKKTMQEDFDMARGFLTAGGDIIALVESFDCMTERIECDDDRECENQKQKYTSLQSTIARDYDQEANLYELLGNILTDKSEHDEAVHVYEKLIRIRSRDVDSEVWKKAEAFYLLASSLMEEGSYEEAKKQLAEARSKLAAVAQGPRESTLSQLILCRQGICSMLMGQYETALKKFENALEENGHYDYSKSPEASKASWRAGVVYNLGYCFMKQHETNKAIMEFELVEKLLQPFMDEAETEKLTNIEETKIKSILFESSGLKEMLKQNWEDAQKHLINSLVEHRKHYHDWPHHEIAEALNHLGLTTFGLGNYGQSIAYFRQALGVEKIVDKDFTHPLIASSLNMIGLSLLCLGDYQEATIFLKDAVKKLKKIHNHYNHPEVTAVVNNLACGMMMRAFEEANEEKEHQKDLEEAKVIFNELVEVCRDFNCGLKVIRNIVSINRGLTMMLLEDHEQAVKVLEDVVAPIIAEESHVVMSAKEKQVFGKAFSLQASAQSLCSGGSNEEDSESRVAAAGEGDAEEQFMFREIPLPVSVQDLLGKSASVTVFLIL